MARSTLNEMEGSAEDVAERLAPNATDHVPVLAEEVRELLAIQPGRHGGGRDLRRRRPRRAPRRRPARRGPLIAIDRDPSVRAVLRAASASAPACRRRFLRGEFSIVLEQLADNGARADAILFDLGVSSMQIDRPERGFSYAADAPLDMRMDPTAELPARELVNEASERELTSDLPPVRRGALREADRPRDRARAAASSRSSGRASSSTTIKAAIPGARALRRRPSGQARLPGAADRGQRRARRARGGASGGDRHAEPRRPPRGDRFHSLEDRIVKRFLRDAERGCICPPDFPVCVCGQEPELRREPQGRSGRARRSWPSTRAPPRPGCARPSRRT